MREDGIVSNESPEDMNETGEESLDIEGERWEPIGEEGVDDPARKISGAVEENVSLGLLSEGDRDNVDGGGYSFMNEIEEGREIALPLVCEIDPDNSSVVAMDLLADEVLCGDPSCDISSHSFLWGVYFIATDEVFNYLNIYERCSFWI